MQQLDAWHHLTYAIGWHLAYSILTSGACARSCPIKNRFWKTLFHTWKSPFLEGSIWVCLKRENSLQLSSTCVHFKAENNFPNSFPPFSPFFPCFPMFSHLPKMFPTVLPPFSLHITGTSGSGTDLSSRATSPASQEETDPTSQQMATLCAELCADSEATGYQIHANTLICIYIICVYIIFICT